MSGSGNSRLSEGKISPPGLGGSPEEDLSRLSYFLQPGDLYASREPTAVTTLLGSCVAVCLWDKQLRIGGISHYLLAESQRPNDFSLRFGNVALSVLLEKMFALGCQPKNMQAKIFGGGHVVNSLQMSSLRVGESNIDLANETMASLKIPIVAQDVGGRQGRKLIFQTDTGKVWTKTV